MKNLSRSYSTFALIGLMTVIPLTALHAAPPTKKLEDLKTLQKKVQAVAKKVLPATVSLVSANQGAYGSGVIVSESGLILTAGHVTQRSEDVTVVFPNGKEVKGQVLGANYTRDSSMVQIVDDSKKWPYVKMGHSKELAVSDLVVALGHAGGYDPLRTPPVRFGRITARGKNQFITTDCALIAGDSGGPLFDLEGRLVAIHSSIGASLSVNNHASIEGFREDWNRLLNGDTWGRLGDNVLDNPDTPIIGILTGISPTGGILVHSVLENGPAAKADIRAGDILLSVNGKRTNNLRSLHAEIAQYKPGAVVHIKLIRNQKGITRKLILGRRGDL